MKILKALFTFLFVSFIAQAWATDTFDGLEGGGVNERRTTQNTFLSQAMNMLQRGEEGAACVTTRTLKTLIPGVITAAFVGLGAFLVQDYRSRTAGDSFSDIWVDCPKTTSGVGNHCERMQQEVVWGAIFLAGGLFSAGWTACTLFTGQICGD